MNRRNDLHIPALIKKIAVLLFTVSMLLSASFAFGGGYDREKFRHWTDDDGNGLNSREEALVSQSLTQGAMHFVSIDSGKVTAGIWVCPYTGEVVRDPGNLDIDHIVPLAWAWNHGADRWTDKQREEFANDPDNLLAVLAAVNRAKGASGPDEWMPPNSWYADRYKEKFKEVCERYKLPFRL